MHFELQYVIFIWAKTTTTTTKKQNNNKKKGEKGMDKLCSVNCEPESGLILVTTFLDLTLMLSYRAVLAGHAFKSVRSFWFMKLTILHIFLRCRNVFNKNFKRE